MIKIRNSFIFALVSIIVLCLVMFAVTTFTQNRASVNAEPTVTCSGMYNWNNKLDNVANYSCNFLAFSSNFSDEADLVNQAASTSYSIATGLKINGVTINEIYNADNSTTVNCLVGASYIYIQIPVSYLAATAEYPIATLTIEEGTTFLGQTLPAVKLVLENGSWTFVLATTLSFSAITWNNIDFAGADHYATYGETTYTPANGKLLLATFTGGTITAEKDYTNLATASYDIGNKLKIDGVPICQISGAHIDYALLNSTHMFIYVPNSALSSGSAVLTIDEGAVYKGASIKATTIYYYSGSNWTTDVISNDVTFSEITWNGLSYYDGYSSYASVTGNGILLTYSANLSAISNEYNGNIKDTNFKNDSIADHIKLNGVALSSIDGVEICYYATTHLWIYVPNMSSAITSEYLNPTLTIDENTKFLDASLPALSLYYTNTWTTEKPEPPEKTDVTYVGIESGWNNFGYGVYANKKGILVNFSANLSKTQSYVNGGINTVNYADEAIGQKIKFNGVKFADIDGAEISYHSGVHLWLFVPAKTTNEEYTIPTLTIDAGAEFLDAILPQVTLYFSATQWTTEKPADPESNSFVSVNFYNNNIANGGTSGYKYVILNYEKPFGSVANAINQADEDYAIGTSLKINGVSIKDIKDAGATYTDCSYAHGNNFLFICYPVSALKTTAAYPITTLTIESGTNFLNFLLDDVTLYLAGDRWVEEEYGLVSDSGDYLTLSDLTNESKLDLVANESKFISDANLDSEVVYKFIYRTEHYTITDSNTFRLYSHSLTGVDGIRFDFNWTSISVYDATDPTSQIMLMPIYDITDDDGVIDPEEDKFIGGIATDKYYKISIGVSISETENKCSLWVAIDDIIIIKLEDITLSAQTGNSVVLVSEAYDSELYDYRSGDINAPTINYGGKYTLYAEEEDFAPEITATATDDFDNDSDIIIDVVWEDGAKNGEGKLNAGEWEVLIKAKDSSDNESFIIVSVVVKPLIETYTVSFDGVVDGSYEFGEYISAPQDPVRQDNERYTYSFDGWYNGDIKWDFANDYVTENINLVAKYNTEYKTYKVTATIKGDIAEKTVEILVKYETELDFSAFNVGGYSFEVKLDGEKIDSLKVTNNTEITVEYSALASGCGSSINNQSQTILIITIVATLILATVVIKRKINKKAEN